MNPLLKVKLQVMVIQLASLPFRDVILFSDSCSISNDIKPPVKLQPSVKNEAINYLSPVKANG